jgi:Ca2+/Na+ antiporter
MGIIFISIFISIPDLYTNFMSARYLSADSALFTHLCSVSCGGTFGFGFSWLIGSMYHNYKIRVKRFYLDEVGLKR